MNSFMNRCLKCFIFIYFFHNLHNSYFIDKVSIKTKQELLQLPCCRLAPLCWSLKGYRLVASGGGQERIDQNNEMEILGFASLPKLPQINQRGGVAWLDWFGAQRGVPCLWACLVADAQIRQQTITGGGQLETAMAPCPLEASL